MLSATDVRPLLETATGGDVTSPRQFVPLLNYPNYWKDFPNICPQASLNSSPISSYPCLLLLHLSPNQGHPKHAGKESGGDIKQGHTWLYVPAGSEEVILCSG